MIEPRELSDRQRAGQMDDIAAAAAAMAEYIEEQGGMRLGALLVVDSDGRIALYNSIDTERLGRALIEAGHRVMTEGAEGWVQGIYADDGGDEAPFK